VHRTLDPAVLKKASGELPSRRGVPPAGTAAPAVAMVRTKFRDGTLVLSGRHAGIFQQSPIELLQDPPVASLLFCVRSNTARLFGALYLRFGWLVTKAAPYVGDAGRRFARHEHNWSCSPDRPDRPEWRKQREDVVTRTHRQAGRFTASSNESRTAETHGLPFRRQLNQPQGAGDPQVRARH
jgi:hypothetical protein